MLLPIDIFVPIHRLSLANLKVICPTAPVIPITLNLGFRMPAWFDIESLENLEEVNYFELDDTSRHETHCIIMIHISPS